MRHRSPEAELLWPCYRLVNAGWVGLADMNLLTVEDVMVGCDALDAIEDATPDPE